MGGDHTPALLFRSAVNCTPSGAPRAETLSTGRCELIDVACRACGAALGWRYLRADTGAERYKEGALLLGKARLRVGGRLRAGGGLGGGGLRGGGGGPGPDDNVRRLDDRFWEALRAARAAGAAAQREREGGR